MWIIHDLKVYNISSYYKEHPGGTSVLDKFIGSGYDAKIDFDDIGHSGKAKNQL